MDDVLTPGAGAVRLRLWCNKRTGGLHMIQVPYSEMTEAERAAVEAFGAEVQTYNVKQAAAILKCTTRTINAYIKTGRLRGTKIAGRWYFTKAEIERLIRGDSE